MAIPPANKKKYIGQLLAILNGKWKKKKMATMEHAFVC